MQADRVDWTEDSDARLMQATLPRLAARPATDQVFFFFFFFFFLPLWIDEFATAGQIHAYLALFDSVLNCLHP
jgi:hypothetical protein